MRSSRKRRRISSGSIVPQDYQQEFCVSMCTKELGVWEAFREEYVESIEQLPLSIHRNFALLHEIDGQALVLESVLPPKIREYIRRRQTVRQLGDTLQEDSVQTTRFSSPYRSGNTDASITSQAFSPTDSHTSARGSTERLHASKILSDVSSNLSQLLRATEEKVNLAQATYDSIDRHVRLLDQAIRDHELHPRNDTSTARIASSPLPVSSLSASKSQDSTISPGNAAARPNARHGAERGARTRSAMRSRWTIHANAPPPVGPVLSSSYGLDNVVQSGKLLGDPVDMDMAENALQPGRINSSADTGNSLVLSSGDMPIDPNEPRYCYCGQVSWGEMIACDATGCEREWFHLGCVGLTEAPKRGKWYCDVCKGKNLAGVRKRVQ